MSLNPLQQIVLKSMINGKNILLTGCGGTGKSYLITKFYNDYFQRRKIGLTSMTGTSALIIGGSTLHSYLGIGLGLDSAEYIIEKLRSYHSMRRKWETLQTLIIDEASMLSVELFEKLDIIAKNIRENDKLFGGIQLILSADFLQLPCIGSETQFCFESNLWFNFEVYNLTEIFRQSESLFQTCLNEIRMGQFSAQTKQLLESRVDIELKTDIGIKPTKLFSHNVDVDIVNTAELNKLEGEVYEYELEVKVSGKNKNEEQLIRKYCRAPLILKLSIGAQVMLITNLDFDNQLVNGSRGVVVGFIEDFPKVKFLNNIELVLTYHTWDIKRDGIKIACFYQLPLKLAWATSIHKSQGQTLDLVDVDLSKIFEYGQGYVALSRVKNLEGLKITGLDFKRIKAHPKALEFYNNIGLILDREEDLDEEPT